MVITKRKKGNILPLRQSSDITQVGSIFDNASPLSKLKDTLGHKFLSNVGFNLSSRLSNDVKFVDSLDYLVWDENRNLSSIGSFSALMIGLRDFVSQELVSILCIYLDNKGYKASISATIGGIETFETPERVLPYVKGSNKSSNPVYASLINSINNCKDYYAGLDFTQTIKAFELLNNADAGLHFFTDNKNALNSFALESDFYKAVFAPSNLKHTLPFNGLFYEVNKNSVGVEELPEPIDLGILRSEREESCLIYDDVKTDKFGDIKSIATHTDNFRILLKRYGVSLRYNIMTNRIEYHFKEGFRENSDNADNVAIELIKDYMTKEKMLGLNRAGGLILTIADENAYHPVKDYIYSKKWDGKSRLKAFCETIKVAKPDEVLRDIYIKRWLLQIVAVLENERGAEAHGVLTFSGEQGKGKTRWIKNLLRGVESAVNTGVSLDLGNKDSRLNALSSTICELGELDSTFRKSDISALKAFLTNKEDRIRKAYAHAETVIPRRTVFFASVNDAEFLQDTTGNRRYWVLEVKEIDNTYPENIDMQQLFAEILTIYKNGERQFLKTEERDLMNISNNRFLSLSPFLIDFLNTFFNDDGDAFEQVVAEENLAMNYVNYIYPTTEFYSIKQLAQIMGRTTYGKKEATELAGYLRNIVKADEKRKKTGACFKLPVTINFEFSEAYLTAHKTAKEVIDRIGVDSYIVEK